MWTPRAISALLVATPVVACIDVDLFPRHGPNNTEPPVTIEVVRGDGQTGPVAAALGVAPVVRLLDASGKPVDQRPVTFAVVEGGGAVSSQSVMTDHNGLAATLWTLGTAADQPQRLQAMIVVPETGAGLTTSFDADAVAGPPAHLVHRNGDGQSGTPGRVLPDFLEVAVVDAWDNPVAGVAVTWGVATGGGSVSSMSSNTDRSGVARTLWTLGPLEGGVQTLAALAEGVEPVRFEARAWTTQVVFSEDFGRGLRGWTGRGGPHSGEMVPDPLDPGNRAIRFARGAGGGDMFSMPIPVEPDHTYELSFRYLGLALPGSLPGNHGGFIGIAASIGGRHFWIAGTDPPHTNNLIEDDGSWHRYAFRFRPADHLGPGVRTIHLMLEDSESPARQPGVPRDAYFDDLVLRRIAR